MGDPNRNLIFATFIRRQYPKAKSVLVIADGKGELSRKLANKGFSVHTIEAKPRFEGKKHTHIEYKRGWFEADKVIKIEEDVIVGMHPDEATGEIVHAALKFHKPFAIIPCCVKGKESRGLARGDYIQWINKLRLIGKCQIKALRFSGRNIVLFRK